ncbi:Aldo/keto reductase [Mycena rebaudengoi]|nr:Aldo/keto reductase [Mycena rebaudengoi]
MTFGAPGKETATVPELKDVEAILDVFVKHGHHEVDTARLYGKGTSEEYFGKINWKEKGLLLETKGYPYPLLNISHTPEDLCKNPMVSLKALKTDKLEMWYLHEPDRSVPYEVTLKAVDELYKEGHFSWEVAELVGICKRFGYIQPTVYQGLYNAIHRTVEPELLPCLRKFGISFYEYNPLAGEFFTNRYTSTDDKPEAGSRLDLDKFQGKSSRNSLLKREYGDAVIIGGSRLSHVEQNLADLDKGPLPGEVVTAVDEAWPHVKAMGSNYYL